jgi:hypothetical protein
LSDEEKKHKCPDCPEWFRTYGELQKHYAEIHL